MEYVLFLGAGGASLDVGVILGGIWPLFRAGSLQHFHLTVLYYPPLGEGLSPIKNAFSNLRVHHYYHRELTAVITIWCMVHREWLLLFPVLVLASCVAFTAADPQRAK
jgi:hypothetical protein